MEGNKNIKNWIFAIAGIVAIVIIGLVARNGAKEDKDIYETMQTEIYGIDENGTRNMNDGSVEGSGTSGESSGVSGSDYQAIKQTTKTMEGEVKNYTQATVDTNMGSFTITLDTANTPNTVANFVKLASAGFYDKTKFHRVIEGFMIQGGDPLSKDDSQSASWGTGGPGYKFADEIKPTNNNAVGTISMANAGPNTNGSQFFINVADNFYLNTKHTVFGKVTSGYDVVEKISKVAVGAQDRPVEAVVIEGIVLQ